MRVAIRMGSNQYPVFGYRDPAVRVQSTKTWSIYGFCIRNRKYGLGVYASYLGTWTLWVKLEFRTLIPLLFLPADSNGVPFWVRSFSSLTRKPQQLQRGATLKSLDAQSTQNHGMHPQNKESLGCLFGYFGGQGCPGRPAQTGHTPGDGGQLHQPTTGGRHRGSCGSLVPRENCMASRAPQWLSDGSLYYGSPRGSKYPIFKDSGPKYH